jgi:hypothetical protein
MIDLHKAYHKNIFDEFSPQFIKSYFFIFSQHVLKSIC